MPLQLDPPQVLQLRDGEELRVGIVDGGYDDHCAVRWRWPVPWQRAMDGGWGTVGWVGNHQTGWKIGLKHMFKHKLGPKLNFGQDWFKYPFFKVIVLCLWLIRRNDGSWRTIMSIVYVSIVIMFTRIKEQYNLIINTHQAMPQTNS